MARIISIVLCFLSWWHPKEITTWSIMTVTLMFILSSVSPSYQFPSSCISTHFNFQDKLTRFSIFSNGGLIPDFRIKHTSHVRKLSRVYRKREPARDAKMILGHLSDVDLDVIPQTQFNPSGLADNGLSRSTLDIMSWHQLFTSALNI